MTRKLKPCGTVAGYARHRLHGEKACEACLTAYREYQRAYRAEHGRPEPGTVREVAPCGTYAAHQRHRANAEEPCEPCRQANRDYQAEWARKRRATQRERRELLDQMLADVLAETTNEPTP